MWATRVCPHRHWKCSKMVVVVSAMTPSFSDAQHIVLSHCTACRVDFGTWLQTSKHRRPVEHDQATGRQFQPDGGEF